MGNVTLATTLLHPPLYLKSADCPFIVVKTSFHILKWFEVIFLKSIQKPPEIEISKVYNLLPKF